MTNSAFVFNEKNTRCRIPDRVLLGGLRRFVRTVRRAERRREDFDRWPERPCNSFTIIRRFGGWRCALRKVGRQSARGGRYTPDELMQILEEVWRRVGRAPGHATLWRVGHVSGGRYVRHWGSLKRARELLARYKRKEISRAELLAPAPAPRDRHAVGPGLRYKVLLRDGHRCQLCGLSPKTDPDTILEVDHIQPVAKGGTDALENLRTLCRTCNRGKAAKNLEA